MAQQGPSPRKATGPLKSVHERHHEMVKQIGQMQGYIAPMTFEDFCVEIVPIVHKQLCKARWDAHFEHYLNITDGDASLKLGIDGCMSLCEAMGLDFVQVVEFVKKIAPEVTQRKASVASQHANDDQDMSRMFPGLSVKLPDVQQEAPARKVSFRQSITSNPFPVDFDTMHEVLVRVEEANVRIKASREREIQQRLDMPEPMFAQYRHEMIRLYDTFCLYDADHSLELSDAEVKRLLKHMGMQPYRPPLSYRLGELLRESKTEGESETDFFAFLRLMDGVRAYQKSQRRTKVRVNFAKIAGMEDSISNNDVETALHGAGIAPKNKVEQDLVRVLIEQFGMDDADGEVSFEELEELGQRVTELLFEHHHELSVKLAASMGFTRDELAEYQGAFDQLDSDGSGGLGIEEVEQVMDMILEKPPTSEELRKLFKELDEDGSGSLEFPEFLHLLQMSNEGQGMFRQGEAFTLKRVAVQDLLDILKHFTTVDSYIKQVTEAELQAMVCSHLGIDMDTDLREPPFQIGNTKQLVEFAVKKSYEVMTDSDRTRASIKSLHHSDGNASTQSPRRSMGSTVSPNAKQRLSVKGHVKGHPSPQQFGSQHSAT
eukprot:gnl/TRDRNA2_/TRDRNA2_142339_c1_seq1.p1 gnl/TRDRNA2_/TRDRNA2_142339_c1~~gnl/TRDRNA2_/TRDRNA2_142339_c1_seq1.p1  ORF type:complete len:699 (-),score=119.13 gnl/TRDRNA2_/TRDRNA2_142339_c1_seq1:85-1887(-)